MSNAQRRREHRQRNKQHPGPMTESRVEQHRLAQTRLADLERLRRLVVAQLSVEERERMAEQEERREPDMGAVAGCVDELREFVSTPADPEPEIDGVTVDQDLLIWDEVGGTQLPDAVDTGGVPDEVEAEPTPCPVCGHPDAEDASLAHILRHNTDEVSGAVIVDWSGADLGGGYPVPYRFRVYLLGEPVVQLYPARLTVLCDAVAHLAVVDVTELTNADGDPIRSTARGKMGVHTQAYKDWVRGQQQGADAVFLGDKFETMVTRFVLASPPGTAHE
jgi:hypothetical protein